MLTFVLEDEVRSVSRDVIVRSDADFDAVAGGRVHHALPLSASTTDCQFADPATSACRQLLPHERVQRTSRSGVAGRTRSGHVEVEQRQSDLSSEVGLDRPRTGQAAAAGRLCDQVGQVTDIPSVRRRLRR